MLFQAALLHKPGVTVRAPSLAAGEACCIAGVDLRVQQSELQVFANGAYKHTTRCRMRGWDAVASHRAFPFH